MSANTVENAGVGFLSAKPAIYYIWKNIKTPYIGISHYRRRFFLTDELLEKYPAGVEIIGEQNQKDFIKLFGQILKMRNLLSCFDEFEGKGLISDRDLQDYSSQYQGAVKL